MSIQQALLILRAHYKIALLALIGTVAITIAVSMQLPKKYTATASVYIDIKPDPIAGVMVQAMAIPSYVATQVDIIRSDRVARNVVKELKLDESPTAREQWLQATQGRGDITVWLADLLQGQLNVVPARESSVIQLEYQAVDPAFAAAVVNAFAQSYINTNIELRVEPAQLYSDWFSLQGKTLRDNLERAQSRLSDFQQKHGIVATDERLDNETAKLNEISTQLTVAHAQTMDAQSKQRSGAASDTLPEIVQNPLINNLKAEIARVDAKLKEMSISYGANHPQYRRMESELAALKQKLEAETRHITSGFSTSRNVGIDREAALREAFEAQKRKLLDLRRQRDELEVLERDVQAAEKAYQAVSERFTQTRLESRSTQTNVSILTPASAPLSPSSPNVRLNTLMAIIAGTILGVGAAFLLELVDRRIRSAADLAEGLRLPVLGSVGKAKPQRRLALGRAPLPALPRT